MQDQSRLRHPGPHLDQGGLRLGFTAAEDEEVVRMAHHFPTRARHLLVERVEIQIRQQGTDDPALSRWSTRRSASLAPRPGRKPWLCPANAVSKIGSNTFRSAACTMRSRTAGMPKGAVQIGGRIGLVPQAEPDPVGRLTRGEPR